MKMCKIKITDISDFRIGNAENRRGGTGCTAVICPEGAVGGVDVRGGGPATRETDLLRSENTVQQVNAVVLSGGSAFGLEAASGVMRELAAKGIGFKVGDIAVPIVCGASLFDLAVGDSKCFPDVQMGMDAVENAYSGDFSGGNHGAGTGATVGKLKGMDRAMKTGLGTFACGDGFVEVGAIVAVNAVGDVYNGAGNIIAGLRTPDGNSIYGTINTLKTMVHENSDKDSEAPAESSGSSFDRSKLDHRNRLEEVAEAIKAEFYRTNKADAPVTDKTEEPVDSDEGQIAEQPMQPEQHEQPDQSEAAEEITAPEDISFEPSLSEVRPDDEAASLSEETASEADGQEEAVPDEAPDDTEEAAFEAPSDDEMQAEDDAVISDDAGAADDTAAYGQDDAASSDSEFISEEMPEVQADPEQDAASMPVEEENPFIDDGDMGYDIPFNTTIGCLITNARLTKSQANKLASILHDAFARAIKPVHSTLDGDTVFVLSSGKQDVNFDAFAALATDVMQYAIIDGAASARGAFGIPAARDL